VRPCVVLACAADVAIDLAQLGACRGPSGPCPGGVLQRSISVSSGRRSFQAVVLRNLYPGVVGALHGAAVTAPMRAGASRSPTARACFQPSSRAERRALRRGDVFAELLLSVAHEKHFAHPLERGDERIVEVDRSDPLRSVIRCPSRAWRPWRGSARPWKRTSSP